MLVLFVFVCVACVGNVVDRHPLDLDVYMTGGGATWHGLDLYSTDVHVREYGFTYPPFAALLFALPARLPFAASLVLMTATSLASLAVIIKLSAPDILAALRRSRSWWPVLAVGAMIVIEPVRATIYDGQINLLLAAMVMWDVLGRRESRWRGTLIGLAAAIKLTPGIFVLYLLARRRFGDAGRAILAFGAATALGWLVLPQDSNTFWLHKLYSGSGIGDISRASNLLGALLRTLPDHLAYDLWAVLAAVTLVVGLGIACVVSESGREAYALGIVGVTGCLVSPVTWTHHWVWCIPWMVGLGRVAVTRGRPARVAFGLLVLVLLALNVVPTSVTGRQPIAHFLSANALTMSVLAVVAACAPGWVRRARAGQLRRPPASAASGAGSDRTGVTATASSGKTAVTRNAGP